MDIFPRLYDVHGVGAGAQGEVRVKPHIIDTAMHFLAFRKSKRGRALQINATARREDDQNDGPGGRAPKIIVAWG